MRLASDHGSSIASVYILTCKLPEWELHDSDNLEFEQSECFNPEDFFSEEFGGFVKPLPDLVDDEFFPLDDKLVYMKRAQETKSSNVLLGLAELYSQLGYPKEVCSCYQRYMIFHGCAAEVLRSMCKSIEWVESNNKVAEKTGLPELYVEFAKQKGVGALIKAAGFFVGRSDFEHALLCYHAAFESYKGNENDESHRNEFMGSIRTAINKVQGDDTIKNQFHDIHIAASCKMGCLINTVGWYMKRDCYDQHLLSCVNELGVRGDVDENVKKKVQRFMTNGLAGAGGKTILNPDFIGALMKLDGAVRPNFCLVLLWSFICCNPCRSRQAEDVRKVNQRTSETDSLIVEQADSLNDMEICTESNEQVEGDGRDVVPLNSMSSEASIYQSCTSLVGG